MLADFRAWLTDLAAGTVAAPTELPEDPVDLHTLLGQFTALRHEVNLQTKAVRAQQEQNAETLRQFGAVVSTLEAKADTPPDDAALRPLLKTLVDVADALGLACQEVERVDQAARTALTERRPADAPPASLWSRWFGGSTPTPQPDQSAARVEQLLASVLSGYRMSRQRLERSLQQHGLEPIPCVGVPFDPERMEVVEAVADSNHPAGTVVAVVRPGYLLHNKVFRYAQVRVAR